MALAQTPLSSTSQSCKGGPPWPPLVARQHAKRGAATEDRPYRTITFSVTPCRAIQKTPIAVEPPPAQ
jgi:hypothetical protein